MNNASLSGDDRLPAYQRLADRLREDVTTGILKPKDPVPSENMLASQYQLAAGTVRKALDVLVNEGVFERFQGKGTFVRRPNFDRSLFRFFRFREPDGTSAIPESRILRREVKPMPRHVATALKVAARTSGIFMSRLRMHNTEPVLAEEIWLPHHRFRSFAKLPLDEIGDLLYPVYDQQCNTLIASATETLTVETASRETARVLRSTAGQPLIVIERIARGYDNVPLEWRRTRGLADQFTYQTEIR